MYSQGIYFEDPNRHSEDAPYKVISIKKILFKYLKEHKKQILSYADIGCGSGAIIKLLSNELKLNFNELQLVKGFDISPHVNNLFVDGIDFSCQDFTKTEDRYDLVTLNDVFEHISNPLFFLKEIGKRAKIVIMHIPLEDCLNVNLRDLQKKKIKNPGHLVYLNVNSAINLITLSGLKIIDYDYSKSVINAPSNNKSFFQKILYPLKYIVLKINPYLYSKIFGMSLVVLAEGIE